MLLYEWSLLMANKLLQLNDVHIIGVIIIIIIVDYKPHVITQLRKSDVTHYKIL